MKKIKEIELRTKAYSFTIDIFEDVDRGEFVAKLNGFTPPLAQEVPPGGSVVYMKGIDEEEVKGGDQERLVEQCKARIREMDGEILTERAV
jgi:hypothetical protein